VLGLRLETGLLVPGHFVNLPCCHLTKNDFMRGKKKYVLQLLYSDKSQNC
jgi:hypothetical protein